MQLNRIRALSFDLDDTLWPFRPCLVRAEAALLTWLRTHAPGTQPLLSDPSALMTYRAQAQQQFPALRTDLSGLRRASIRALLEASQEDIALVEPAFEVFFEERQRVELYPEVLQALTQLSERLPLVALTNGNACIHKAGIGHFFKGALSAASLGVAKPEPQAFHAAAALAGVHPSEVLHVGDDWHLDVVGAVAAGAQAVWMVREDLAASAASNASASLSASASAPGADSVPHLRVAHLTELCEALAGLH
jgi:FMN hydrolase / 5-amino-6-(5-phospho-D-ribitylamino)uracil phosphatase